MRGIVVGPSMLALLVGLATGAEACSSADGEVAGGKLRPGVDAAAPPALMTELPDAPATSWRDLYRDFFSQNAPTGCAQVPECHDTAAAKLAANGGTMPEQPVDFAFSAEAIERTRTSLRSGANKD
jgi:hypothetical protein